MAGIKIREFKGLKTYIDSADIDNGYFNTFENLRPRIGYAEAQSLNTTLDTSIILPVNHKLILMEYVFLDEDKYKNEYNGITLEYKYVQNIQKYRLIITYTPAIESYHIYLAGDEGIINWDDFYVGSHNSSDAEQYPYIINEKGICKILFKEKSYWLGKIDRWRWNDNGTASYIPYPNSTERPFHFLPLVGDLQKTNNFVYISKVEGDGIIVVGELQDLSGWKSDIVRRDDNYKEQLRLSFYKTVNGEWVFVRLNTADGYLWAYNCDTGIGGIGGEDDFIAVIPYADAVSLIPNPDVSPTSPNIQLRNISSSFQIKTWNELEPLTGMSLPAGKYYYIGGESLSDIREDIQGWAHDVVEEPNAGYQETIVITDKGLSPQESYTEYIVTAVIEQNEFPIRYFSYQADASKPYVLRLAPFYNEGFPDGRTSALVFYFRSGTDNITIKSKDFEQFWTLPLLAKDKPTPKTALTSLSSNGIQLTQTIGKTLDPDTYKIETAYDDYINVNGTAFILKNGNVLYPAIGNGIVRTDMFYPENYIPQVSGKFLATLENKLAVFEENKEEMTYIDFQSVEGQLIFFVRGSAMYKIKDYWDLIETPEGIIINLPDGIYATNGETRSLISSPINDIMKKRLSDGTSNYDKSSIYYNSYEKEVLYVCIEGIYVYRFETNSWSKMDFVGTNPTSNTVIDIIDDYKGNMRMLLTNNEVYKIEYKNAIGKFGLTNIDLGELAITKRLNWIAIDANCKVSLLRADAPSLSLSNNIRKILFFNTMLKNRKPNQWLDFLFTIEREFLSSDSPKIYNMEINFEAFPIRKV